MNAPLSPSPLVIGGKKSRKGRKGNKSLTSWVAFVKKVAREEKIPYGKAMKRAAVRKNKGEKWMTGGQETPPEQPPLDGVIDEEIPPVVGQAPGAPVGPQAPVFGQGVGGRRRGSKKRHGSKKHRGTKKRRGSRRRHH